MALLDMRHLRLRSLILGEESVQREHMVLLINAFGSNLEVLKFGNSAQLVDAATLDLLALTCSNLKHLKIFCEDMPPDVLASAFGPGRFPKLETLVTQLGPVVNDEVTLALCTGHPNLESIGGSIPSMSISSVAVIMTHCPRFRSVELAQFAFNTVYTADADAPNDIEAPYYKLILREPLLPEDSLHAFKGAAYFKHKVRELEYLPWRSYVNVLSDNDVEQVIDAFGKDLHILNIELGSNVTHHALEKLGECTALRTLSLSHCATITDDLLMMLADECQYITSLSFTSAEDISDEGVCHLLERMGPRLISLVLNNCPQLTDTVLSAIAEHCDQLESLDISDTDITAEAIISDVIEPDRLPKLTRLDCWAMEEVCQFVADEENDGLNRRWLQVLDLRVDWC